VMENENLNEIKLVYIDCPECEGLTDDEQYTCTTCWCEYHSSFFLSRG
jgi:hypothetical protein